MRASIPVESSNACGVPERRLKEMQILRVRFRPFPSSPLNCGNTPKLMSTTSLLRRAANQVYERAFPIYRPLYAAYKTYADRAERELLRKILLQGAVVADVGANIGIYSQFLSRCVGPGGRSIPSNHRQITSGDCLLPHVISETSGLLRL